ncbi:trimeric intracellular cation channel family protein [Microvirga sp. TS319]|uniref:trimeric intracellular cation channel family protein n=1 Tax=Microvirga sp. TS319 TaxID=3241165 RepID=UPI00351AA71D
MFDTFAALLDWFGVIVFATTGALVASRKQMDLVGFVLLGTATGIGGGTIRDTLINALPVFWVKEPAYLVTCVLVSCAAFFLAHIPQSRLKLLLWFDAIGMALFAVTGAEKALLAEASPIVAVAMGVITATFGGVVRDVLGGESPVILSREIYASAALAGAAIFVALALAGTTREFALTSGFLTAFVIRAAALRWDWSLPRYRPRPGRTRDEIKR